MSGARAAVRASDLSHGEARALEIAMALACRPMVMLLDEPMAGMGHDESRAMNSVNSSSNHSGVTQARYTAKTTNTASVSQKVVRSRRSMKSCTHLPRRKRAAKARAVLDCESDFKLPRLFRNLFPHSFLDCLTRPLYRGGCGRGRPHAGDRGPAGRYLL